MRIRLLKTTPPNSIVYFQATTKPVNPVRASILSNIETVFGRRPISKKKEFYDELLADNKTFLSSHPASELFVLFDSLIYIGIDLKNGLLDNDPERANKALARAKEAKSTVSAILTRIDQQP